MTFHCQGLKRTRDPAVLATCDIVVDVGAVYDESKQLFDHHQRGFTEIFGHGFETKLSSAGLVYKCVLPIQLFFPEVHFLRRHFGKEVIANRTQLPIDDPKIDVLWLKMYRVLTVPCRQLYRAELIMQEFIEAIDGIDNGVSQYPNDIKPKYRSRTDLSSRVGALNPWWNQPTDAQSVDVSPATMPMDRRRLF